MGTADLGVEQHGQRLPGTAPVPFTEVIACVPAQGAVFAPLQADGMEAGQAKEQAGPGLGLLGAQPQNALG